MSIRLLQAITTVRVGDGSATADVSLPVLREKHTGWPVLPGSSLKGALRARANALGEDQVAIERVFGPAAESEADDYGEISGVVGTARFDEAVLLALPVRSLSQTFALLVSPLSLARFARALGRTDLPALRPQLDEAIVGGAGQLGQSEIGNRSRGVVFLEDLDLNGVVDEGLEAWRSLIAERCDEDWFGDRLTVVHDDVFAHACRAWLDLRTRNAMGKDGVVEEGKLFSVEGLPPETLWWWSVRGDDGGLLPEEGETFALGGHQSVGLGRVAWYGGEA